MAWSEAQNRRRGYAGGWGPGPAPLLWRGSLGTEGTRVLCLELRVGGGVLRCRDLGYGHRDNGRGSLG